MTLAGDTIACYCHVERTFAIPETRPDLTPVGFRRVKGGAMAGSTAARGYGYAHQRMRDSLAPIVASGRARCAEVVCLMPDRWIPPGSKWDLAHGATRDTYRGPAHARCNRSEGARRRNRKHKPARAKRDTTSRAW